MKLSGYDSLCTISQSNRSVVFKAVRIQDQIPVILKAAAVVDSVYQKAAIEREHEILKGLNLEGVARLLGVEEHNNEPVLVFEDSGGQDLKSMMDSGPLDLKVSIKLAIGIAAALGELHSKKIIHKDINPTNIIFIPDSGKVKLIDFGSASLLTHENPVVKSPGMLTGTLAYMSPEQTGRMNRHIDWRTDFYSLGVTLYELFVNDLPFRFEDPLELVHAHIARKPVPPIEINDAIPLVISKIILKLMSKNAEDRYQSAWGIRADLEECLRQLQEDGSVKPFPLALHDIPDRFQIHQKLYGREQEISVLMEAFNRVSEGRKEMMLVAGQPGVGKTSLIKELYKPITQAKGYFISGKFDQFQRNVPYSAVVSAFRDLVSQLLSEGETVLSTWRSQLLNALGPNGQVIVDAIPEVELIIGPQPPVPDLGTVETQNRFKFTFQNFIHVFCQQEHPLTVFIDDLQWADTASLNFLEMMITDVKTSYLFVTGAYRDNEVDTGHPLLITLANLEQEGVEIHQIRLGGLNIENVTELIADTIFVDKNIISNLAELIVHKTSGNPFFVNELLKSLYDEKLIRFDTDKLAWKWDIDKISTHGITENVVELMAKKIQKLKGPAVEALKTAAAIGNRFDLDRLAMVLEMPLEDALACVNESVNEGLLLGLGTCPETGKPFEFKFSHDRVQQAAYSLILDSERPIAHLKIGRLLLEHTKEEKIEDSIFEIVNQLNLGVKIIEEQSEKTSVSKLNLQAGKKAKESAAFETSLIFFRKGIELLPKDSWQNEYHLTLSLFEEASESAFMCAKYDDMERLTAEAMRNARNVLDKVKCYETKIEAYSTQNRLPDSLETGLNALRDLGLSMPRRPMKIHVIVSLVFTKIALFGNNFDTFLSLPLLSDKRLLSLLSIMNRMALSVYLTSPDLTVLIFLKSIRLTAANGICARGAGGIMGYAMVLIGGLNQIESGYQFAILSTQLADKMNNNDVTCYNNFVFECFIRHWKEHPRESLKPLLRSYQLSLETGFATWAGYSQMWIAIWAYVIGKNLPDLERLMSECREAARIVKHQASYLNTGLFLQAVDNLMGKNADPCQLTGDYFDETTTIQFHIQASENYGIHSVYLLKLKLCYLFYRYDEALLNADKAKPYEGNAMCTINIPLFNFYESLTNLAIAENNKSCKKRALKIANRNQKKMKVWAHHAPMNHRHKYCLVEAERHRVLGKHEKAMGHYDTAISGAHENGYIQEEALANELAAKFYLDEGKIKIARTFLLEALNLYSQWGATAKVKHLADNFKELLAESARGNKAAPGNERYRVLSTSEGHETRLDIGSVIKASQVISGEIVFTKLVDRLLTIAMENAGARKGFLILESHGRQYIEAEGTIDPDRVIVQRSIPSEKGKVLSIAIINFVTRTKDSVVLNNACQEGKFDKDPYVLETKAKSILCMPLIHRGKLTGMLYLENNLIEGAFTHDRLEVLRVLCAQAAISFESSRLYEQLEEHSRSLEQRVDERTAELKESLETLKRAQNQLVQSEKMAALGSLVAGVAHEVNTPVGVAITAASLLEERTDELVRLVSTGEIRRSDLDKFMKIAQESARMVLSNLRRAGEIIQSFKQVAVDQSSDEKRSFKLKSYIDDILLSLTPKLKRTFHTVKVQCPDDLELNSYPGAFYQIITNLVMNSLIHGFLEGDKGEILIEVTRDAEMYLFHYRDNGKGMDAKTLDKIFDPFFTTNRSKGGSGLGMHIVYNLATQTLGGKIECISSLGNGIQIFIRFPV